MAFSPACWQYGTALSHTSPQGMVGEALDLLSQAVAGERLEASTIWGCRARRRSCSRLP